MAAIDSKLEDRGQAGPKHVDQGTGPEQQRHAKVLPMIGKGGIDDSVVQRASYVGAPGTLASAHNYCASCDPRDPFDTFVSDLLDVDRAWTCRVIFGACCLVVMVVSVYDAMLVVLHRDLINKFEQNPIGRWFMDMQAGDVWLFVSAKLIGTALVCALLVMLYEYRVRLAVPVSGGLACFQLALLWYLTHV